MKQASSNIVNYSELSRNKKQQFLSFLMNNNIKFQEGQENYYAKVVIQQTKNDSSKPKSPLKKKLGKQNIKPVIKPVNKLINQNKNTKIVQKKQLKTPVKNERFKTETLKSSKSASSEKQINLSDIEARTQYSNSVNRKLQSQSIKKARNRNISDVPYQIKPPAPTPKIRQRSVTPTRIREKQEAQKLKPKIRSSRPIQQITRIEDKLDPYLRIFKITMIEGRPVRWPRHQLNKYIEQIYTANFIKNTILLKSKKFKQNLEKNYAFAQFISEFYLSKYKNKKLAHSNIINIVSSLIYHIENQMPTNLIIFSKFITEQYNPHDLVFFLFIRSIAEKQFNIDFQKLVDKKQKKNEDDFYLTKKQITRYIKSVIGKQQQLVPEFQALVFRNMRNQSLSIYKLFEMLVEDYHYKSKDNTQYQSNMNPAQNSNNTSHSALSIMQKSSHRNPSLNCTYQQKHSSNINQTFENLHIAPLHPNHISAVKRQIQRYDDIKIQQAGSSYLQDFTPVDEELTFGEEKSNQEHNFWGNYTFDENKVDDKLQATIMQKMRQKVQQFVKILISDEEDLMKGHQESFNTLILQKSYSLIDSIFKMDKIKWFNQLLIRHPNAEQHEFIENLQLLVRKLRKNCQNKELSDFCKQLLTTPELKAAIGQLME